MVTAIYAYTIKTYKPCHIAVFCTHWDPAKWPHFCRRLFQTYFLQWKYVILIQISLKFGREVSIYNHPKLVQNFSERFGTEETMLTINHPRSQYQFDQIYYCPCPCFIISVSIPRTNTRLYLDLIRLEVIVLFPVSHIHQWKPRVAMMPTLSSLAAPQVSTTCGAASDDKVGIMSILGYCNC